ncbi:Binding-protein-dependent transport system innermembrane component [Candidatus Methanoperedenaceae archaeon GB50]|nr:MAG: Binding-protein-dependent transport system innermembrane component [Candidatus Methanoperedenaceae archaeon GB50]CAD7775263.1 Binding-protein-dependent transport system innermembrane component [Candidatus Methanoperedenaceae archaeon GB37]CAD7775348.1 Binding-protein-dependent transport system innermembrane component [Candidatus Methanoperedenaceae archaeon GB50]
MRVESWKLQDGRWLKDRLFTIVCFISTMVGVLLLFLLLWDVFTRGLPWLSWDFLTSFPSRFPERAGIKSALFGSIWLILLTAAFAVPIGVGAAIYLEEYAPKNRLTKIIEINISNLAGVPSIVYGILGLTLFVRTLLLGRSLLAGALTMALLILPIIIISSQEALRAVPKSIREASYALGATRWQTIRHQVLPAARPWILTGNILALSRALGETAPLIMVGALSFVAFVPRTPLDPFTALPIQIFSWVGRPQEEFASLAAAGIIVLMAFLLTMNATAIILRNRYQRRLEW